MDKKDIRARFVKIIDGITKKYNITDKEVCQEIGIPNVNLSQMRAGKRNPTTEQIAALCMKYNYSLDYVITGTRQKAPKEPEPDLTQQQIAAELKRLAKVQEEILKLLQSTRKPSR